MSSLTSPTLDDLEQRIRSVAPQPLPQSRAPPQPPALPGTPGRPPLVPPWTPPSGVPPPRPSRLTVSPAAKRSAVPEFIPLPKPRPTFDASPATSSGGAPSHAPGSSSGHAPLSALSPSPQNFRQSPPERRGAAALGAEYDAEVAQRRERSDGCASAHSAASGAGAGRNGRVASRNGSAGAVGAGDADADADGEPKPRGAQGSGLPSRTGFGVLAMGCLFFAPLCGLFALSALGAHAGPRAPPFWCPAAGARAGPADAREIALPLPPLAFANRSSGLQAGYSDLRTDPADGCLAGCESTPWPSLASLPPALAIAAASGAFDLPPAGAAAGAASGDGAAPPAPGAPIRLRALTARLAPAGADLSAACSEHDRCYATWRRRLSEQEHRSACDGELLGNLVYACAQARSVSRARADEAAGVRRGAGALAELPDPRCELLARLTHFLVTGAAEYGRAQAAAEAAVVSALMASMPSEKSRTGAASGPVHVGAEAQGPTQGDVADWATTQAGRLVGAVHAEPIGPTADPDPAAWLGGGGGGGDEGDFALPQCEVRAVQCS